MNQQTVRFQITGRAARELPAPAGCPSLVIALGEFGRRVCHALASAAAARPEIALPRPWWVGPAGLAQAIPGEAVAADAWPDAGAWAEQHLGENLPALRAALLHDLQDAPEAAGAPDVLDLYLVAHLDEPFGRALWPGLLAALRASGLFTGDLSVTLLLATDSRQAARPDGDTACTWRATLRHLETELRAGARGQTPCGGVQWCYLVDTRDLHGRPLRPIQTPAPPEPDSADVSLEVQVDLIAEFIALACAGLARMPAYRRTALPALARDLGVQAPPAWVSTLCAGSAVLPVPALTARAVNALAGRLVTGYILGPERASHSTGAQKLRTRWLAECALEPAQVHHRLMRGRGGQPLQFVVEPPDLSGARDETLLDRLKQWDALLAGLWTRPESPPAQIAANAAVLRSAARAWLAREGNELLQHTCGGARYAATLAAEAGRALAILRERPDEIPEQRPSRLAAWLPARRRPDMPIDIEHLDGLLARALHARLDGRALGARAGLAAAALTAFLWPAYHAASLSLMPWTPASALVGLGLVSLPSLASAWGAGGLQFVRSELAIARALDERIRAVCHQYAGLTRDLARAERAALYDDLENACRELAARGAALQTALEGAALRLRGDERAPARRSAPRSEQLVIRPTEWEACMPAADEQAEQRLAEEFLSQQAGAGLADAPAEDWAAALGRCAAAHLARWAQSLALTRQIAAPGALVQLAETLRARLRPAWPLSAAERAALSAGRHVAAGRRGGVLEATFVGLPPGALADFSPPPTWPHELFCTGERGRLSVITTVHALNLSRCLDRGAEPVPPSDAAHVTEPAEPVGATADPS